jgi:hypothetical protein
MKIEQSFMYGTVSAAGHCTREKQECTEHRQLVF